MDLNLTGKQKGHLKVVLKIAEKAAEKAGEDRPALQTVRVEVNGTEVVFVTADGFRMAGMRFTGPREDAFSINVNAKTLSRALPGGKRKEAWLKVEREGVSVKQEDWLTVNPDGMNGYSFPDWRSIVPQGEVVDTDASFNYRYAETLLALYEDIYPDAGRTGLLRRAVVGSPGNVRNSVHAWAWEREGVGYLYVLMPMHSDKEMEFVGLEKWGNLPKEEGE